mmetsp:Transcript_37682/g.86974  ORF Transcript_37682/g.86974 Transcript_37682/m.86974 type:complete len:215 (-) Transcript_37682:1105-1749(-)
MSRESDRDTCSCDKYCSSWARRLARTSKARRCWVIMEVRVAVRPVPTMSPKMSTTMLYTRSIVLAGTTSIDPGVIWVKAQCIPVKYSYWWVVTAWSASLLPKEAGRSNTSESHVRPVSLNSELWRPMMYHTQVIKWLNRIIADVIRSTSTKSSAEGRLILRFNAQNSPTNFAPNLGTCLMRRMAKTNGGNQCLYTMEHQSIAITTKSRKNQPRR